MSLLRVLTVLTSMTDNAYSGFKIHVAARQGFYSSQGR